MAVVNGAMRLTEGKESLWEMAEVDVTTINSNLPSTSLTDYIKISCKAARKRKHIAGSG